MLKSLFLSLSILLTSIPVLADPGVASTQAEVAAVAAEKCKDGCLIFSPADVGALQDQVNAFAKRAFIEGAKQGFASGQKDCRKAGKDI